MILDKHAKTPYATCKNAKIRPQDATDYSGMLEVGGGRYLVSIMRVTDSKRDIPRVWAYVQMVNAITGEAKVDFAKDVAIRGRTNPEWGPVKVDLRNGKTAFAKTWTHDYPDDAAMDEFLGQAARFIESHIGELAAVRPSPAALDIDDLLDRL